MLFVVEQKKDRSVGPRVFDSAGLLGGHRALRSFVRARGGLPVTSLYPTDRIAASANSGLTAGFGSSAAAGADYPAAIEAAGAALTTDQSERMRWRRGARHSRETIRICLMGQSANALTGFTPLIIHP